MFLSRELTPARRRDRVKAGFAIGLRSAPISADEASLLQPHQRRIQRAHVELQGAAGHLLEACGDRVAVQRPERIQRLEDQQVERALQDLSLGLWLTGHANVLSPRTLDRQMKGRCEWELHAGTVESRRSVDAPDLPGDAPYRRRCRV